MKELTLARFFQGSATAAELAKDLAGAEKQLPEIETSVEIEDMPGDFHVTREMAIALCDAVLCGTLPPEHLATIAFALMASDRFEWDGDDVHGDVIADWAAPEINYPLNMESVRMFRSWLSGTEVYPDKRPLDRNILSDDAG